MKMRQLSLFALVMIFAVASLAFAQAPQSAGSGATSPPAVVKGQGDNPESGMPPMCMQMMREHGMHGMDYFHKKLGITDDQKKEFRALRVGFMDRTRKARAALYSLKDEKRAMLMSGNVDQKKLASIDDQIIKLKTENMTEKFKMKRDKLALLNPEQLQKLGDLMSQKSMRHGKHGGHWGGKGEHFGAGH